LGRESEASAHYARAVAECERIGALWLAERCRQRAAQGPQPSAPEAPAEPPRSTAGAITLEREGEVWAIRFRAGPTHRLKHGKGLLYLQRLLEHPGREVHVLELAGIEHRTGDAGPILDADAKAAYGARLSELREQAEEAERFGDLERARRTEREIDAIAEQLATAVGLGGRDRRAASDVERVRINVQRRLKDAIDRIAAVEPDLGRYLAAAVKTGTTCVFEPLPG
jgi:non-specific serine/threonine protein kinase